MPPKRYAPVAMPNAKLSVNVNKVALLRNQRDTGVPDLLGFCKRTLAAGAAGITVHPRPDGRHIRTADVARLADLCRAAEAEGVEFNIEGNPLDPSWHADAEHNAERWPDWLSGVLATRPDQATFVPDSPDQSTSDHGFDCRDAATCSQLRPLIARCQAAGIRVSLFIDIDPDAATAAAEAGCERVELYTGPFAAGVADDAQGWSDRIAETVVAAHAAGLAVNAGHDLDLTNLPALIDAADDGIAEVSIGHAFTADCLLMGVDDATRAYLDALKPAG